MNSVFINTKTNFTLVGKALVSKAALFDNKYCHFSIKYRSVNYNCAMYIKHISILLSVSIGLGLVLMCGVGVLSRFAIIPP